MQLTTLSIAKRFLTVAATAGLAVLTLPAGADALPNARWRCKMTGDIPLGTLTVSGSTYQFVVAKNTVWDAKPGDPGNGSGELRETGGTITPVSGPLASVYGVVGEASKRPDGTIYIAFNSSKGTPFACWQG